MNIKFKENTIYFKINPQELTELNDNKTLKQNFCFPYNKTLGIALHKANSNNIELSQQNSLTLINCKVNKNSLQTLKEMGKNKNGLTILNENLNIILQLDIKKLTKCT